jgi:Fe2+ transport system protein B
MSGLGTTNIDSLPTAMSNENITLQTKEKDNVVVNDKAAALKAQREIETLPQRAEQKQVDVNELVSGIQQASASGQTKLPSRDIPKDENRIQQDVQIKPNFVPDIKISDYITEHQTSDAIIRENANKQTHKDNFDDIYAELSLPILTALLYFMYQLPAVRKIFIDSLPFCYTNSGNLNFTGYLMNSVIFGFTIYAARKLVDRLSG